MMKKICRPTASFKEGRTLLTGTIVLYGVILYIMGKRKGNKLESFPY